MLNILRKLSFGILIFLVNLDNYDEDDEDDDDDYENENDEEEEEGGGVNDDWYDTNPFSFWGATIASRWTV